MIKAENKATAYLKTQLETGKMDGDPYSLAITTYALALVNSDAKDKARQKLRTLATEKGRFLTRGGRGAGDVLPTHGGRGVGRVRSSHVGGGSWHVGEGSDKSSRGVGVCFISRYNRLGAVQVTPQPGVV